MSRLWFRFSKISVSAMMLVCLVWLVVPAHALALNQNLPVIINNSVAGSPGTVDKDYVPDEIVIKLVQSADIVGIASDFALDPTPLDQFGTRPIFRMRILDGAEPLDRAAELEADPRVLYAEPNFLGQTPEGQQRVSWAKGGSAGEYVEQWAVDMIRLPQAHALTRGVNVTLAVLDTGVDSTHPVLAGRLVSGFDFVDMDPDPSEVGNHEQNVVYGHGTHVAGLIALAAPEAKIMPVRVLDPDGVGNIWVIAEALAFAVNPDGNLNTADGADVINLSLSTTRQTDLLSEIVAAITCVDDDDDDDGGGDDDDDCLSSPPGAVVIAAAGNSGSSTPEYPAAEGVAGSLSVGASTMADTLASFSNFGPWVSVAAPGESILSSVPGGEYAVWSGTSMATPLASGVAALVRSMDHDLDPKEVVDQIIANSKIINGSVPRRIDALAALALSLSGEFKCMGASVGAVTVDNLTVPKNQTCILNGTQVQGNVKVEASATLFADFIDVGGSVQADGATSISVNGSAIEGSLQFIKGGSALLNGSTVNGDVQLFENQGSLTVSNNTIDGNLQCKTNSQMPTGGGNIVQGNKEDQCSGL